MSGHVALVCLCVLFVWSVSSTVLREDGDQPSAETEDQAWTRIVEKHSRPKLDARTEGVEEKLRLTEQLTACTARTLVLQTRLEERREGAEETRRVNAEQLASVNSRLDTAQQKIITTSGASLINQKETESLRAEVVMLKQQLEESAQNLKIKSQHLERLEKTKAQCDLEVTALTGDVAKLRGKEEEWEEKLGKQTSDLQREIFQQIINSTKTELNKSSTKLDANFLELTTFITKTVLQIASDSNFTSNTIMQGINNVRQESSKKSEDLLKEISSGKSKLQEGFARMTNERDSKFSQLQSEHGDILKVFESTKKQATIAASTVTLASGLVSLGDKFYYFSKEARMSWHAARDFCISRGLSLASIESDVEQKRVYDHKTTLGMGNTWVGASDEAQEGTWRWTGTGATLTYTNWASGLPGRHTTLNCLYMWNDLWHLTTCSSLLPFICEQQN